MKKKPFEDPLKGLNITYRRGKDLEEWSRFESTFKAYNIKLRQLISHSTFTQYPIIGI